MKLGRFQIEQLSEGQFEIFADGAIHRKPVDEEVEPHSPLLGTRNSALIGINPILISDREKDLHILLDTGLGWGLDAGSKYENVSNVLTNLDIFDLSPEDISHVVLTHLHYDHAAGCSYTDASAVTNPTFPNATYHVQQQEWEHALQSLDTDNSPRGAGYRIDDLYRLKADDQFRFIRDSQPLSEGVEMLFTGGHTPGHQAIRIRDEGKTAYYLGDLLPNEHHLNQYGMRQMDVHPLQAKKMKTKLLRNAFEEEAVLLFYHSLHSRVGRLVKDEQKKYTLREI